MNKTFKSLLMGAVCIIFTVLCTSKVYADELLIDYSCDDELLIEDDLLDDIIIEADDIMVQPDILEEDILIDLSEPVSPVSITPVVITPKKEIVVSTPVVSQPVNPTPVVKPANKPVASTVQTVVATEEMKETLRLINVERAKVGVKPLTMTNEINSIAKTRVDEASRYYAHTRPNGKLWSSIFAEQKVDYNNIGENLLAGVATPERAVASWLTSSSHKRCMLSSDYTSVGIGIKVVNGVTYWVLDFIG